ncbi:MAG: T9SS type A sorting domain-containing protein [Bacteroidia bacterium]|nr:T9SS type A sorting domain-containing protein [Bacteroidia bacterium]
MKKIFLLASFFLPLVFMNAQEHACAKSKIHSVASVITQQSKMAALSPQTSHELKYDVKFVHLNLNVERINKYISGGVKIVGTVTIAPLDTFQTLLHLNLTIDSIRFNGVLVSAIRQDSIVKFKTPTNLNAGAGFTTTVYYKGTPPNGGSAIGSGFSNATSGAWNNQATWSLSESFVAYHWWPCKQILTDKIDSSWVFITTDSLNKAGSNGLLKNVVVVGNKKRYEWKSRTPIDYYLISVAVARYKEYKQYAKPLYLPNDSILIQNYIYDNAINNNNWINQQKVALDKMPQVMSFLCNMYGMYPFYKEKYGHCMAPLGGGMEHQTMTTLGFFEYYINAHELGHQWWGDNVTCKSWGDIWINEGFASYTEHLVAQYLDPVNFAGNLNAAHNAVMGQPGGSVHFTGSDTLNSGRIFSSRLTYDKGGAIIHSLRFLTNNDSTWFNCLRGFQNTYKNGTASAVDFQNYYQTFTGINPTQFFSQWYYGEGYPTFTVKYNYTGTQFFLKSSQTVSMPSATPLFITPIEYKISRAAKPDTTIRLMHSNAVEDYTIALNGTVTAVQCDPNNWLINKSVGPSRDASLGVPPNLADVAELNGSTEGISIGPNPTRGLVEISNKNNARGFVEVYALDGRLLAKKVLAEKTSIDLSDYSAGVYLIKFLDPENQERMSQKVIKE